MLKAVRGHNQPTPRTYAGNNSHTIPLFRKSRQSIYVFNKLNKRVKEAVEKHRIFTIHGDYEPLRKALVLRGWIEKFAVTNCFTAQERFELFGILPQHRHVLVHSDLNKLASKTFRDLQMNASLMSIMLNGMNIPSNLVWTTTRTFLDENQMVNKFPEAPFTTKIGLCKPFTWMPSSPAGQDNSKMFVPRCYVLNEKEGRTNFLQDFRLTACFNILKWIIKKSHEPKGLPMEPQTNFYFGRTQKKDSAIPSTVIEFALKHSKEYFQECDDSYSSLTLCEENYSAPTEDEWKKFMWYYYLLIHDGRKLQYIMPQLLTGLLNKSKGVLKEISKHWPQLNMDGTENIWIIKPAVKSKDCEIYVTNKLDVVLNYAKDCGQQQYVVQKYIEKPMLVLHTKFDIRQWFMTTDWDPLTIWMYRANYIRFCSQTHSSRTDVHESIHVSNSIVQKNKCIINKNRDHGHHQAWQNVIYPGICDAIIEVLLAYQKEITNRKNSFELYAADFILTEDLQPWLIKIIENPPMGATTTVTSRLCSHCLEDAVKVVIDRREHKNCKTGNFELVYKQPRLITLERKNTAMKLFIRNNVLTGSTQSLTLPEILFSVSKQLKKQHSMNASTRREASGKMHMGKINPSKVNKMSSTISTKIRINSKKNNPHSAANQQQNEGNSEQQSGIFQGDSQKKMESNMSNRSTKLCNTLLRAPIKSETSKSVVKTTPTEIKLTKLSPITKNISKTNHASRIAPCTTKSIPKVKTNPNVASKVASKGQEAGLVDTTPKSFATQMPTKPWQQTSRWK